MKDPIPSFAEALMTTVEMFSPVKEAATGYRVSLIEEGWEPAEASRAAADLHHLLTETMIQALASRK